MAEYIERETLLKAMENAMDDYHSNYYGEWEDCVGWYNDDILDVIEKTPTAGVQEVRHGENVTVKNPVDEFICSECGFMVDSISRKHYDEDGEYYYHSEYECKYCPECGAKMDKE